MTDTNKTGFKFLHNFSIYICLETFFYITEQAACISHIVLICWFRWRSSSEQHRSECHIRSIPGLSAWTV